VPPPLDIVLPVEYLTSNTKCTCSLLDSSETCHNRGSRYQYTTFVIQVANVLNFGTQIIVHSQNLIKKTDAQISLADINAQPVITT